jgi:hypothetical protein
VFGEDATATQNRIWLSSIAVGTLVGAGVGVLATDNQRSEREKRASLPFMPYAGVVGQSTSVGGAPVPIPGGGVQGVW